MRRLLYILFLMLSVSVYGQKDPAWDDTSKSQWDSAFEKVEIRSSVDGEIQKAFMYKSKGRKPKPLIVSLHTWSGNYTQKDPLTKEILARDWNYIHPDFRGQNNRPEAMGSELVVSDIADAIAYAVKNANVDTTEVHIVGVSGGGFATLSAYMNLDYPVKSFSAWAPISDIESWYLESVGRSQKYARDIIKAVGNEGGLDRDEAVRRSPLKQVYPKEKRKDAKLYIYEGVHDGYTGSVPITHSINMYNRLVGELKYGTSDVKEIAAKRDADLVSEEEIITLVTKRMNPEMDSMCVLYDRNIHLSRSYGSVELVIFEGGHEQLPQALGLIPYKQKSGKKCNILTIGDSNGHIKEGWTTQLKSMMPEANIVNISQSGRTIGFDNNGRESLNGLRNIDSYMIEAQEKIGSKKYDYIIICLGTNDTKKVFADRQDEVVPNFEVLLDKVRRHKLGKKAHLVFVTPPPMRTTNILDKYTGGNERLAVLVPQLMEVAAKKGFTCVDIYHPLLGVLDYYAKDGIHMSVAGQEIVASKLLDVIEK